MLKLTFSKKLADGASCDRKGMFAKERTCFFASYAGGCSSFIADQLNSLFITTTVTVKTIYQLVGRLSVVRGEAI